MIYISLVLDGTQARLVSLLVCSCNILAHRQVHRLETIVVRSMKDFILSHENADQNITFFAFYDVKII